MIFNNRSRLLTALSCLSAVLILAGCSIPSAETGPVITTIAGTLGVSGFSGDNGPATSATLNRPDAVFVDSAGRIFIADTQNHVIRLVSTLGNITTIAGTGGLSGSSGDNGPAVSARLDTPSGLWYSGGDIYVSDRGNHVIRRFSIGGNIQTAAGIIGVTTPNNNGVAATTVGLWTPMGMAFDNAGNFYFAENNRQTIRKVDNSSGIISRVAGSSGQTGTSADGVLAVDALLRYPEGVYVDDAFNVFIVDTGNGIIRRVNSSDGRIHTVAGAAGTYEYFGDNGPATTSCLNYPSSVHGDSSGNLYIADTNNHIIRKVDALTAVMSTIAGTPTVSGSTGNNVPARSATLKSPKGVFWSSYYQALFIADTANHVVRMVK